MTTTHKDQIIMIGGGEVFTNRENFLDEIKKRNYNPYEKKQKRKFRLQEKISTQADMFIPDMPNKIRADYDARKIRFEKIFPYITNDKKIILIGHSLGTIFLTKYLSENKFLKTINQLHLVSAVFDEDYESEKIHLGNFVFDPNKLQHMTQQCKEIYLYHSEDDPIVPISQLYKFKAKIPDAKIHIFEDRQHINQENFPELFQNIYSYLETSHSGT